MKILTRIIATVFVGTLLFLTGCDSLNLEPKDELGSEQVFQDPGLTEAYLNEIYARTGLGFGDPMLTPGIVDEALNTHGHPGDQNIMSSLTPGDRGQWDSPGNWGIGDPPYQGYNWSSVYASIRDLNLLIGNMEGNENISGDMRQQFLGEAYFLKGFFFHNLMKLYGGVPIIDGAFELADGVSEYQVERNTFESTVNEIVADLDSASTRLEGRDARQQGAATQGAALALKSRVLLFAASDLYHESPFSGSNAAEYVSYAGSSVDRDELWRRSRDAAQEVIDLTEYSLQPTSTAQEYHELFTEGNASGIIWARYFNENGRFNHNHSQWVSPNGYFSWSGDTPTQQHVEAYEMADGSQFEWEGGDPTPPNPDDENPNDPVEAENPYEDRDPRFYANIHYSGAEWRSRPAGQPSSVDPVGVIMTGTYETVEDGSATMTEGLDTRNSGIQDWNGSRTGYNLRKFVDRNVAPNQEQSYVPWIYIRYAEVLLNYAEAQYELQGDATTTGSGSMSAKEAVDMVRDRVNMPGVPPDGGPNRSFIERIRQEREVELAFEGHRYFDVRRWMIGDEAYQDALGIDVYGDLKGPPNQYAGMTLGELIAQDSYNYRYKVTNEQDREWQDKNYFLPFSNDEMNRNPNLVQNPGY